MLRAPPKLTRYAAPSKYKRPRATTVRKKTKTYGIPTQVRVGRQAFPKQLFNTLKYTEVVNLALVAGLSTFVFSCNGMFDPNSTGAGHQPLYYDQLTAVYDHYTVLKSRIKVTYGNATILSLPQLCTIYVDDDLTVAANAIVASEKPMSVAKWYNPLTDSPPTLYQSWDGYKIFGADLQTDPNLQGTATANPTEQSFYIIQQSDQSLNTVGTQIFVELEYDVVWDEFVTVNPS